MLTPFGHVPLALASALGTRSALAATGEEAVLKVHNSQDAGQLAFLQVGQSGGRWAGMWEEGGHTRLRRMWDGFPNGTTVEIVIVIVQRKARLVLVGARAASIEDLQGRRPHQPHQRTHSRSWCRCWVGRTSD